VQQVPLGNEQQRVVGRQRGQRIFHLVDQTHVGGDHLASDGQQAANLYAADRPAAHVDGRLDERQDEAGDAEAVVGQIAHFRLVNALIQLLQCAVRQHQVAELLPGRLIEVLGVPQRIVGVESD